MKDKLLLIFNEPAGIPHIGSVQLGDADIHSNLTNYIEKIYNYEDKEGFSDDYKFDIKKLTLSFGYQFNF